MNVKMITSITLYALLGLALSAIGITAVDNPASFFTIVMIVLLIDINGSRV
jgi:hypothetical protein